MPKETARVTKNQGHGEARTGLTVRQHARRKRLLAAAMDLAAEGGYESVQMRDVARRANVALGTLYRYFSSKDHLLAAMGAEWTRDIDLRGRPLHGKTSAERVMNYIYRATRALEREPKLADAIIKSLSAPDQDAEDAQHAVGGLLRDIIEQELEHLEADERTGIRDIIGQVWYSNLVMWVSGRRSLRKVYESMEIACRLLLDKRAHY